MSFKVNSSQQISFNDSVFSLTAREKKALDNSWAKIFADEIFPNIDEERFSVLYSSKASRPNAPVNVIIGALIIKELFDYSDDEIVENLMLDLHLQYALHTTSFEEQPISDKTLSRFRSRCYNYETTHGIDLYHDCVKDLSSKIAKLMNLSGRIKRMDSMMIESISSGCSFQRYFSSSLLLVIHKRLVLTPASCHSYHPVPDPASMRRSAPFAR